MVCPSGSPLQRFGYSSYQLLHADGGIHIWKRLSARTLATMGRQLKFAVRRFHPGRKESYHLEQKAQKGTMSELLANALPVVALKEGIDWEEDCYEQGKLCPSEEDKAKTSTNKLTQKPEKLPVQMESMRHDIEFRQSNRSADFIQGIEEEESDDRFINRGRLLHTLFSVIETAEDIEPAIDRLIFEGVIRNEEKEEMAREVAQKAFSSPEIQDWYSENGHCSTNVPSFTRKRSLANSPSRPCNDERRAGSCRRF